MGIIKSYWIQILIILVLATGIAAGLYLVQRQQIFKPKAAGPSGINIGFNVTGLTHYGYGDLFPNTKSSDVDAVLSEVNRLGGKIIRIWVANKHISDEEAADRLNVLLTKTYNDNPNISFLVGFMSWYEHHGSYPQSAANYFDKTTDPYFYSPTLNDTFFKEGYKTTYLPFIKTVIDKNKHHKNIYAWEIGNEFKAKNGDSMMKFAKDVSEKIKLYDREHRVSTGFLRAQHATNGAMSPANFYSQLPKVDVISVVAYNGDMDGLPDITWAAKNKKIPLIAEGGFDNQNGDDDAAGNRDRSRKYEDFINFFASQGAKAYLVWAFQPKSITQSNGNDDNKLGMDNLCHTDYDNIALVIQEKNGVAESINSYPTSKFIKFDISSNERFTDPLKVENANLEQAFLVNYSPIYIREYYGIDRDNISQCRDRQVNLNNGQGILLGNTLIQVDM